MNILTPPAKLVSDMKQVGTIMLADWQKKAGSEGQEIVSTFNASAGKK